MLLYFCATVTVNQSWIFYLPDPCQDGRLERYPYSGRCSAYWLCVNGSSTPKCCNQGQRYSSTGIKNNCVPDSTCNEACEAPVEIIKKPPSGKTYFDFFSLLYVWQQRTLTPQDTWSCPTLGLASVLMWRSISLELVLFPDF